MLYFNQRIVGDTMARPKKYNDKNVFEKKVKEYFEYCDKEDKPYTMSGLAFALDMDRKSLLNYSKDEMFFTTKKKAREKVEQQLEENALMGKANATFTIFNLKNNYGWVDKQEQEVVSTNRYNIINDLPKDNKNE